MSTHTSRRSVLLGLAGINMRAGSWLAQGLAALVGALFMIWVVQALA